MDKLYSESDVHANELEQALTTSIRPFDESAAADNWETAGKKPNKLF